MREFKSGKSAKVLLTAALPPILLSNPPLCDTVRPLLFVLSVGRESERVIKGAVLSFVLGTSDSGVGPQAGSLANYRFYFCFLSTLLRIFFASCTISVQGGGPSGREPGFG